MKKIKKKKAINFTQEERNEFIEAFYWHCPVEFIEAEKASWGCPWDWCPNELFDVTQIKLEAERFYEGLKDSIMDELLWEEQQKNP